MEEEKEIKREEDMDRRRSWEERRRRWRLREIAKKEMSKRRKV